ncbi:hypothetical protein [Vacuolonema iberomarrocanum]|uniref:hypothetical protein n=1 Tax=Vacuolonema iberomarrocanum TaxID=3454632 RepID=UPI0019FA44CB|nr:hypothetical protein [filamentous cyanobacterium LEGE 07170]
MNHALSTAAAIAVSGAGLALFSPAPVFAQETAVPEGFQLVEGDLWSYAIPQDWQETQYPQPDLGNVTLVSQHESPDGEVFINMVTEPYPGDMPTYLELNLDNMQSFGFVIHNQTEAMVGSLVGAEVESSVPIEPATRVLQRFTLTNGTGYVLTCRTLESTFSSYRDRCSQILETFRVSG